MRYNDALDLTVRFELTNTSFADLPLKPLEYVKIIGTDGRILTYD